MDERVETTVSAAGSGLEGGSSFAVARAMDVGAPPQQSWVGMALRGSNPASRGSKMADWVFDLAVHNGTQCRAGRRCKDRQVPGLACACKGLVVTHRRPG